MTAVSLIVRASVFILYVFHERGDSMKRVFRFVAAVVALMQRRRLPAAALRAADRVAYHRPGAGRSSRAAMPGVTVTVTSKQTGAVRTAVTGGEGEYTVTNLGPGTYTVAFELSGFANQSREVLLGVGQLETIDVTLASRRCRKRSRCLPSRASSTCRRPASA